MNIGEANLAGKSKTSTDSCQVGQSVSVDPYSGAEANFLIGEKFS